jgi:hypothetical protein
MNLNFNDCEIKERKYIKWFIETFNIKNPDVSNIGSFDRKDMVAIINNTKCVFEFKCRETIKGNYEETGLLLEVEKYNSIKKLYPDIPFIYVNILEDNRVYIFKVDELLPDTDAKNRAYTRIPCPISTCDTKKGIKDKPVYLLKTNTKYSCKKFLY